MTLTILVTLLVALAAVFAAGIGFQVLRGRRALGAPGAPPAMSDVLNAVRGRVAGVIAPQPPLEGQQQAVPGPGAFRAAPPPATGKRPGRPASGGRQAEVGLQPTRGLALPGNSTLEDGWPPGLAVAALSAGPAGAALQDVYYVQRNLIALARGLTAQGDGQRAAALTLSAIMTSKLGQVLDIESALREGASAANRLVSSISQRDPKYSDMVTTLDVVYLTLDGRAALLHFAHVGSSAIWVQQAGSPAVRLLTRPHIAPSGQMLRAVGQLREVAPDIGQEPVEVGDRIFLTTAGPSFAFTEPLMNAAAGYYAESPLHDAVAALAQAAAKSGTSDDVTIVGAEVARPGTFLA